VQPLWGGAAPDGALLQVVWQHDLESHSPRRSSFLPQVRRVRAIHCSFLCQVLRAHHGAHGTGDGAALSALWHGYARGGTVLPIL
jgi:hypothetical protein